MKGKVFQDLPSTSNMNMRRLLRVCLPNRVTLMSAACRGACVNPERRNRQSLVDKATTAAMHLDGVA